MLVAAVIERIYAKGFTKCAPGGALSARDISTLKHYPREKKFEDRWRGYD